MSSNPKAKARANKLLRRILLNIIESPDKARFRKLKLEKVVPRIEAANGEQVLLDWGFLYSEARTHLILPRAVGVDKVKEYLATFDEQEKLAASSGGSGGGGSGAAAASAASADEGDRVELPRSVRTSISARGGGEEKGASDAGAVAAPAAAPSEAAKPKPAKKKDPEEDQEAAAAVALSKALSGEESKKAVEAPAAQDGKGAVNPEYWKWSSADLLVWLKAEGLTHLIPAFKALGFDGSDLEILEEEELEREISSEDDRKKVLEKVAALKKRAPHASGDDGGDASD